VRWARGATPPPLPADIVGKVVLHESRRHSIDDVRRKGGLRLHSVERAAVDAATWSRSGRTACGVLAATVQQRLTTADRLHAELDVVGRVWGRRLMRAALLDIGGGSQALSEIDFVRFCRRRGLPEPTRQSVRLDLAGRRRYLDVEWLLRNDRSLAVEIDGVGHVDVDRWYADLLRTAELVAGRPSHSGCRQWRSASSRSASNGFCARCSHLSGPDPGNPRESLTTPMCH